MALAIICALHMATRGSQVSSSRDMQSPLKYKTSQPCVCCFKETPNMHIELQSVVFFSVTLSRQHEVVSKAVKLTVNMTVYKIRCSSLHNFFSSKYFSVRYISNYTRSCLRSAS
jgi:hypothetical protein